MNRYLRFAGLGFLVWLVAACSQAQPPVSVATTIEISPPSASINVGASVQLAADVFDAQDKLMSGVQVRWSSNNAGIATVDSTGQVTGVAEGQATITAKAGAVSKQATITVKSTVPPLPTITVEISAVPATTLDGDPCIQFYGRFSETVQVFSARVTLPLSNSFIEYVPTSPVTATPSLIVAFQADATCYFRRSGIYRIDIQLSKPNQPAITISATYNSPF